MRIWMGAALLLAALSMGARAADAEHVRGEYRFGTGPVPGFVAQGAVRDAWPDDAPGAKDAPWRVWRFDRQADRRSGRDHVYVDYAYQARSSALMGEAGKYEIEFSPRFQRLVIHGVDLRRDGRWESRLAPERITLARRESEFESDTSNDVVSALVVLDDVRPDDVVRLRYSTIGSNPVMGGLLADFGLFAWSHPLLESRLRVLYPPRTRTLERQGAGMGAARVTHGEDATEVVYSATHAAPMTLQDDQPAWFRPRPWAYTAQARDWADVVRWALPMYPRQVELPPELAARVATWRALPTRAARMQAALRAVQDEVRYFGVQMGDSTHRPAAPAVTWQRRYGDCKDKSYLLATLLRAMDFDAAPALVSVDMGRGIADEPPSATAFDHVIVEVREGGRSAWLDPTRSQAGGAADTADLSMLGLALPVREGATALVAVQPPAGLVRAMKVDERLVPDGVGDAMRLEITTRYEGAMADHARGRFATEPSADRARRYADYYRKRFGELTTLQAPTVDDARESNVLTVREAYRLHAPWRSSGAGRFIDTYAEGLSERAAVPATPAGRGPVSLGTPSRYEHRIEVQAPAGWTAEGGNGVRRHEADAVAYTREFKVAGHQVVVAHALDVRQREVPEPAAVRHADVVREMGDSLNARLYFNKPASQQRQQRDARLKALLSGDAAKTTTETP